MTVPRDIQTWLPTLVAMLQDAPPQISVVEGTTTFAEHSFGWSFTYDGANPTNSPATDYFREAAYRIHQGIDKQFGAVLRASRAGLREVHLVELPQNVSYGLGGDIVGDLVRDAGALPAPYRRQAERCPRAAPAPGADPSALAALAARKIPGAQPATQEEILAVEARLGIALPEEIRALYLTAGSGELVLNEDPDAGDFYGIDIIPLGDGPYRQAYLPENRLSAWKYGATETLAPDPDGRIQPLAGTARWFPVGTDGGGNVYCADLAPAENGHYGQVIFLDHELSTGAELVSDSFTDLLVHQRLCPPTGPVRDAAKVYLNRVAIEDAAAREDLEVVCLGISDTAVDLGPLLDRSSVRSIDASCSRLADPMQVNSFPALEYLSMTLRDWRALLDSDGVPGGLMAANIDGADAIETVAIANEILTCWERPLITVTALHLENKTRRRPVWWRRSKPS